MLIWILVEACIVLGLVTLVWCACAISGRCSREEESLAEPSVIDTVREQQREVEAVNYLLRKSTDRLMYPRFPDEVDEVLLDFETIGG